MSDLTDALERLDEAIADNEEANGGVLKPGATDRLLDRHRDEFGDAHEELEAWFRWHNGQRNQEDRPFGEAAEWMLLSISEAIDAWEELTDPDGDMDEPLPRSWFPILHNGEGDYILIETGPDDPGVLYEYRSYDDFDDTPAWGDLIEWAEEVAAELDG